MEANDHANNFKNIFRKREWNQNKLLIMRRLLWHFIKLRFKGNNEHGT